MPSSSPTSSPSSPSLSPTRSPSFGTGCLSTVAGGCHTLTASAVCLGNKDGRAATTISGRRVNGEPCVWCGGSACTSDNSNKCEPYHWVVFHPNFVANGSYTTASCRPTTNPSTSPTSSPAVSPTAAPTAAPTVGPSTRPPTRSPTGAPVTLAPTPAPTAA
eukprot:gene19272-biopygen4652